jgi:protein-tyrosine phosphatase
MKILFVCLGNICRSPMAEGIMAKMVKEQKLNITVDSAGTSSWHAGEHPDKRAIETAAFHGVDISNLVARPFTGKDFEKFDKIYVMDEMNYHDVMAHARAEEDKKKVHLFLEAAGGYFFNGVPDPYYGGALGFEKVFSILDDASRKILAKIHES